jgi:excinuclease ABC subunit B
MKYNIDHNVTPTTIRKSIQEIMLQGSVLDIKGFDEKNKYAVLDDALPMAAEPEVAYKSAAQLDKVIAKTKKEMEKAAKDLDFMEAARLRDNLFRLQKELEAMK